MVGDVIGKYCGFFGGKLKWLLREELFDFVVGVMVVVVFM